MTPMPDRARTAVTRLLPVALAASLAACGANTTSSNDPNLSPAANEGRALYLQKGCGGCHGPDAEGLVGPELVGLAGTRVEVIVSGERQTVTADEAYLRESIVAPDAKQVADARTKMPTSRLSDTEVDRLVAYLVELGEGDS